MIAAYRRGAEEAGREPGEIILQGMMAWAESDEAAFEGAREWKATLVDEHYTDDVHRPAEIQANGQQVSDRIFMAMGILSADPDVHVRKIKALQQLGATAVVLMKHLGRRPARDAAGLRRARAAAAAGLTQPVMGAAMSPWICAAVNALL